MPVTGCFAPETGSFSELMSLGKIGFADPAIATRARLSVARGLARLNDRSG
jgi:hypothetical protein